MIKAGDRHVDEFPWGKAEQFHTIEVGEEKFQLFDFVRVTTKEGKDIYGQIGYISKNSVDLLPDGQPAQNITFKQIETIAR